MGLMEPTIFVNCVRGHACCCTAPYLWKLVSE